MKISIVLAVEVNAAKGLRQPFLFRTYHFRAAKNDATQTRNPETDGKNIKIKDVLAATSAAPSFFKGAVINGKKYRDGTIWNANPANEVRAEVEEMHSDIKNPIRLLISVGCGVKKPSRFGRYQRWDDVLTNHQVKSKLQKAYHRFDGPSNLFDLEINEWRSDGMGEDTFKRIRDSTAKFCETTKNEIKRCARELVECRRMRAKTPRWEKFALGIEYVCKDKECQNLGEFETRGAFIYHLLYKHNEFPPDDKNWEKIQSLLLDSQTTVLE